MVWVTHGFRDMTFLLVTQAMSAPRNGQPLNHVATRAQRGDRAVVDYEALKA
jgi:hypothetical protein